MVEQSPSVYQARGRESIFDGSRSRRDLSVPRNLVWKEIVDCAAWGRCKKVDPDWEI